MNKVPSYPKILAVGAEPIQQLFDDEVEVTEKIDGSMFAFGVTETDGHKELTIRSKGVQIFVDNIPKMFKKAVDYILTIEDKILELPPETYFYTEYLAKPKHNVLAYDRVPKNNLILFGVCVENGWVKDWKKLKGLADKLEIEVVPLLVQKKIKTIEDLKEILEMKSVLGNEIVEGIVVKNYKQLWMLGNRVYPQFGKYVREVFKERHLNEWSKGHKPKDILREYIEGFRTEARWLKGIQHLKEKGELEFQPRDIGKLMKEIHLDIVAEEKENIKKELYKMFIKRIKRKATAGFAEFYKTWLAERVLEKGGK